MLQYGLYDRDYVRRMGVRVVYRAIQTSCAMLHNSGHYIASLIDYFSLGFNIKAAGG